MMPHIFHIDIYFIFLREWKSVIFRLLINRFYIIQNSKQVPSTVVQTIFKYGFVYDEDERVFIQTDLSGALLYLRR